MHLTFQNFSQYDVSVLYKLMTDVYATAQGMSDVLEERFPTLESFATETEKLLSLAGSIALIAEFDRQAEGIVSASAHGGFDYGRP